MSGWIKLHRKIAKTSLYPKNREFTKFEAWIDLILMVNHSEEEFLINNDIYICKRGQSVRSIETYQKYWNWSRQKVRSFFNLLQKNFMIELKTTTKTTILSICNYDSYQSEQPTNNQQITNKQPTNNQQITTNKNDKKEKNVKNENNYKTTLLSDLKKSDFDNPKYLDVTIAFFELFKKNLIEAGASTSTLEKSKGVWVDHIRLMYETDKQTSESVKKVFEFLQVDEFWKKNILSTATLRKQFNKLLMNAKNKTNGTKKQQPATSDEQLANIVANMFSEKREQL